MRSLLCVVVIAAFASAEPSLAQESPREPLARQVTINVTLKRPVNSCAVPLMAALIARQLDVPSGVEQLPGPCTYPEQPTTEEIPLIGMPLQDVLDRLVKADPRGVVLLA